MSLTCWYAHCLPPRSTRLLLPWPEVRDVEYLGPEPPHECDRECEDLGCWK